jgi:hypothetical protein
MEICNVEYVSVVLAGTVTDASAGETLQTPSSLMRMPAVWTTILQFAQGLVYAIVASVLVLCVPIHMR